MGMDGKRKEKSDLITQCDGIGRFCSLGGKKDSCLYG